jgi:hypothetical protein
MYNDQTFSSSDSLSNDITTKIYDNYDCCHKDLDVQLQNIAAAIAITHIIQNIESKNR